MPLTPSLESVQSARRLALGMKDNLRQVRQQVRSGARAVADRLEAAGHRDDPAERSTTPWVEPLQTAALQVLQCMDIADRVASGLLGSSWRHDEMRRALVPVAQAIDPSGTRYRDDRLVKGWYVAWNLLLRMRGDPDVMVAEGGLHELLQELRRAAPVVPRGLWAGLLVWHASKAHASLLRRAAGSASAVSADDRHGVVRVAAAFAVACESFPQNSDSTAPIDAADWVRLADEWVIGGQGRWSRALASADPVAALSTEVAFHVRHL